MSDMRGMIDGLIESMPLHVLHLRMQIAAVRMKLEHDREPTREERLACIVLELGGSAEEAEETLERLDRHEEAEALARKLVDRVLPDPLAEFFGKGRR